MRPVNLLPAAQRTVVASGERAGASYFLLGALALVLIAVIAYAVTGVQLAQSRDDAARIGQQATVAEAEAAALAPFGEFSELKNARITAVTQLALGRLDWERLVRELALVLPRGTWLTAMDGNANGQGAAAPAPGTAGAGTAAPVPTITLTGCAKNQRTVATALVRLRRLNGAQSVELKSSDRPRPEKDSGGSGAVGGCGKFYSFNAIVELDAPGPQNLDPQTSRQVPTALGGGS
ncbi:MAG: PilN domain-containing protein [Thermoleophilaceae bacterium]|nr:PilN domain-containing protein [Thermoleophilaceae bacterium]